ncbi:MAG: FAD-dependent oxidoreductase, partial [Chloroflexi bacterium]|nr:FAD-dependent oxidoreductase [Chloroflexota bacterium]
LDGFKAHPMVQQLISGGTTVEYSAHLVPAGGMSMVPRLYTDGFLVAGDAAALVLATGLALEGINFALASGMAAAEAVKRAKEKGDFTRQALSQYEQLLSQSFVLQDLRSFSRAAGFLENERLYSVYPDLACQMAKRIFEADGQPKKMTWQVLRETMKGKVSLWRVVRDALSAKGAV